MDRRVKGEVDEWLKTLVKTLELDQHGAGATIVPSDRGRSFQDPQEVISSLPLLQTGEGQARELKVLGTLGQGGMGEVWLAEQVALGRQVAVKSMRGDAQTSLRSLLQEAWITGYLEHPNIVPIYTLGRDSDGAPLIVMKRVEGVEWRDYVLATHGLASRAEAKALEWHLRVLIQVCRAVGYAHSRGIVHRDVKPENVMIGRFGEVYVLDWGIAVSLSESLGGRLPLVSEATLLAGTPSYMAPEMASGRGPIDVRTDIYLLGAVLHEVLVGQAPHQGAHVHQVLMAAYQSEPHEYPSTAPAALVAIARRAMAREPAERYVSAEALAQALEEHLEHRVAYELERGARERLAELRGAIEQERVAREDERAKALERRVLRLFGAARFGFEQALAQWSGLDEAREGLSQALEIMASRAVAQGQRSSAESLIAELEELRCAGAEALATLRDGLGELRAQSERVEAAAQLVDDKVGRRGRDRLVLLFGLIWFAIPVSIGIMEELGHAEFTYRSYFIGAIRFLVIALVLAALFRKTLLSSEFNRRIGAAVVGLAVVMIVFRWLYMLAQAPLAYALPIEVLIYALFTFTLGLWISPYFSALGAIFLGGALLMIPFSAFDDYILGTCNLLVLLGIRQVWRQKGW